MKPILFLFFSIIFLYGKSYGQDTFPEKSIFNHALADTLEKIHYDDQHYRERINGVVEKSGYNSEPYRALWDTIHQKDSLNLATVTRILDRHGWLGKDVVGETGNATLWLVIQHADTDTQLKYLPLLRKAVNEGNAEPSQLALTEDRVLLAQGKKQIYGSQIMIDNETGEPWVQPIEDPDNVDKRRAEVGLPPMNEYLKIWNLTWDVEKHKKWIKKMEADKSGE